MDNNDLIWQNAQHHLAMLTTNFKYLEANQRNAESGTTGCSAAGGGIEQGKPARSAGWQAGLIEVLDYAEERRDYLSTFYKDKRCIAQRIEAENFIYWISGRIAEERRRSEERTEPPAG